MIKAHPEPCSKKNFQIADVAVPQSKIKKRLHSWMAALFQPGAAQGHVLTVCCPAKNGKAGLLSSLRILLRREHNTVPTNMKKRKLY